MSEYLTSTYVYLDYFMYLKENAAKEQRSSICSNTVESNPATHNFSKDSRFEPIVFPPFVKRSLLRDCFNYIKKKLEYKQDE